MKAAFLGTGLMGSPMSIRLVDGGHEVTVYNRTKDKTKEAWDAGAKVADVPEDAIKRSDVVITMVTDGDAVKALLLKDESLAELDGKMVIQMSTISPDESIEIAEKVRDAGADYMESPVLGSTPQAKHRKLILMVGAEKDQYEKYLGLLASFGPDPVLVGPVGQGAAMKLAMNQLIASMMTAFATSFAFVKKQDMDTDKFMQILERSALYAGMYGGKADRVAEREFSEPNFPAKHLLKDVRLFLERSEGLGIDTRALESVRGLFEKTIEKGHEDDDYSSVFEAVLGE